jgi:hypothetical protein
VFRILFYMLFGVGLYFVDRELVQFCGWSVWKTGSGLMAVYLSIVILADVRPLLRQRVAVG